MSQVLSPIAAPRSPAEATLFAREHDALERLYILRGQLDFLRARQNMSASPSNEAAYPGALSRLERSYGTAVREYEAVHAARLTSASVAVPSSPVMAWDPLVGRLLFLGMTTAVLLLIVGRRRI